MPVRDMSSGFRLYRRAALADLDLRSANFEVLEEVLVKAFAQRVQRPRDSVHVFSARSAGVSHARLFRFGLESGEDGAEAVAAAQLDRVGRLRRAAPSRA